MVTKPYGGMVLRMNVLTGIMESCHVILSKQEPLIDDLPIGYHPLPARSAKADRAAFLPASAPKAIAVSRPLPDR